MSLLNDTMTSGSGLDCAQWQAPNDTMACDQAEAIRLVTYSYLAPVVICVGMFGNAMTILVLRQTVMRRAGVVYQYLRHLAFTDLCMQICLIPMLLHLLQVRVCSYWAQIFYSHIGYSLVNALMGTSVWLVVFLTFSQYVAVCRPLRASTYITSAMSISYVCNFAMYVPWAWRRVVQEDWCRTTIGKCQYYDIENTVVMDTIYYELYQWIRECASRLLPFACLLFMNGRILFEYTRTKRNRQTQLATMQSTTANNRAEQEEKRLWMLLGCIVMVFFVCTIPAAPLTILIKDTWGCELPFQIFRSVTNLLEFTKFALNFYLYCMVNPDMRRVCVHKLLCRSLSTITSQHNPGTRANLRSLSKAIQSAQVVKQHQQQQHLLTVPNNNTAGLVRSAGASPRRMHSYAPVRSARSQHDTIDLAVMCPVPQRKTSAQSMRIPIDRDRKHSVLI